MPSAGISTETITFAVYPTLPSRVRAHSGVLNKTIGEEAAMKLPRRQFLHLAAGAAALPAMSRFAWAQGYLARPVRVVPFAAGGSTDISAHLIGQWLSERLENEETDEAALQIIWLCLLGFKGTGQPSPAIGSQCGLPLSGDSMFDRTVALDVVRRPRPTPSQHGGAGRI